MNLLVKSKDEIIKKILEEKIGSTVGSINKIISKYSFKENIQGFQDNQSLLESLKTKDEESQTLIDKQIIEVYQNILFYDEITKEISLGVFK